MSSAKIWTPPPRTAPYRCETLPWERPLMLAPLEGVSHPAFRQLIAEQGGVGILCTEFVRITSAPVSAKQMKRQVVKAEGFPLSVQVMGNDVENMRDAAALVSEAGADVVDINLGCPAPRVVKKGVGSAMLKDPALLYEVICAMREGVPGLLSAKIRAGFDEAEHVVKIARTVEAAGADYLVVHPRRRCDFYKGVADWRIIERLKAELSIPVIGNGDVWYAQDALRMMEETGCDGVMIGRPALRNPWIFRQAAALMDGEEPYSPTGADIVAWLEEAAARYTIEFPRLKQGPVGKIKELLTYLGRAIRDGGDFRKSVLRLRTLEEILAFTGDRLGDLSVDEVDLAAVPASPLEKSGTTNASQEEAA